MTGLLGQAALVWLVALFGFTGSLKLLDPGRAQTLRSQRLLPAWSVRPTALALPVAELSISLLLALSATRAVSAILAGFLALAFAGYSIVALRRGVRGSCGCGSSLAETPFSRLTVARAGAMVIASALVAAEPRQVADLPLLSLLSLAAIPALALHLRARLHRHEHHHMPVEPPRPDLVELLRRSSAPSVS